MTENERYTKDDIKESERYRAKRDIIDALLKEDVLYSLEEAEDIINSFMEGRV